MERALAPLAAAVLLAACAHAPVAPRVFDPAPLYDDAAFRPVAGEPGPAELFALPAAEVARLRAGFEARAASAPSKRVAFVAYIGAVLADFQYDDHTMRAADVLAKRRGNCLGLALLTASLARELKVPYVFQEVLAPPAWDRKNGLMLVNRHVNVWVFDPENPGDEYRMEMGQVRLADPASVIDFFPMSQSYPARYLADEKVVAMFYGNAAAEALVDGDADRAYAAAREALAIDPDFASGWNVLGLVYARRENPRAEPAYLRALDLQPDDATAANNLAIWLDRHGRIAEAARLKARIDAERDANPFEAFDRGEVAFRAGDYREAATLFRRAADADPYQHEFQFGLFRAYWMLGRHDRALAALRQAIQITEDGEVVARYNRKLKALSDSVPR
jgi:Flp pilus assembly protein TadD